MPGILNRKRRLQGHQEAGAEFGGIDLRSLAAFQSKWDAVSFTGTKLGLADFRAARLDRVRFEGCSAYAVQFLGAYLEEVVFTGCDLEQACFQGAVLKNVEFLNCRMAYSNFAGATMLSQVIFDGCNLHGADLDVVEGARAVEFSGKTNLWGAKIRMDCQFWTSQFDRRMADSFLAMASMAHPDAEVSETLKELAGDQYGPVERLMREVKEDG